MADLKLIFAGTPDFAAAHLQALLDAGMQVCAVYTQPDRAAGRGKKLQASPVKQVALAHDLPVFQPASLKNEQAQAELAALDADLMVVVAYGLLLPQPVLDTPRFGCINVHASLLPRWRGAAPIERALLAGDERTGITIMQMDIGLDTGDMLHTVETPIGEHDTRISLEQRLTTLGCEALLHTLGNFETVRGQAVKQDDALSTYARKLDKAEAQLDWTLPAVELDRRVRAGVGRLPAFSWLDGERVRFLETCVSTADSGKAAGTIIGSSRLADGALALDIATVSGTLQLSQLQLAGKNAMSVRDLLNARREQFAAGRQFVTDEVPVAVPSELHP